MVRVCVEDGPSSGVFLWCCVVEATGVVCVSDGLISVVLLCSCAVEATGMACV